MTLAERIRKLLSELEKGLIERENLLRLAFLAIVTQQPTYLYGRAGSGKRALVEHLVSGFRGLNVQSYGRRISGLPEESEPLDIAVFTGFEASVSPMTTAIRAILDENLSRSLLVCGRNRPEACLAEAGLADSIHLVLTFPDSVSPDALKDLLSSVGDPNLFTAEDELKVSRDELDSWDKSIEQVEISEDSLAILKQIAAECERSNIYISVKRWRGLAKMAKAQAFFAGRTETNVTDILFLSEDLWGKRINGKEYIAYSITVFNEPITLFCPLSRVGTNEDFFPLNILHREETRAKCNYMGGDICKISIDSKAKRNGMRASSSMMSKSTSMTPNANTVYEDYAKLPSEILRTNDPAVVERNRMGLQDAHEKLFEVITHTLQSLKQIKALYNKNFEYQNDPFLSIESYKIFMNRILKRYKALGEFSKELQQYESVLSQISK